MGSTEPRPVMVITGAARGIGAAIARAAAPTHDVVINYASNAALAEQVAADARRVGAETLVHQADVGHEQAVVDMFAAVDERFGRLDVLVNNAGIAGGYGRLETVRAEALERLWAVNVTGAFICAREAVVRMSTKHGGHGGSIVNISSKAAILGGSDEWIHYAASKGAIDTMTAGLSKEVGAEGIRVNSIRPGLIESDFHDYAPVGRIERIAPSVPMQRPGRCDEVADVVMWIVSSSASYVTGTFLDVTGGR